MPVTIAVQLDESLDAELDALASSTKRAKSALVADALRSYVASERQFMEAVQAGLADLEAGWRVDHDSVVAAVRRAIRLHS